MAKFSTKDAEKWLGVSGQTIRNWTKEFSQWLNEAARPSSGRRRIFLDDDLRVLSLVHHMTSRGMSYAEVHAALGNGERGDVPDEVEAEEAPTAFDGWDKIVKLKEERDIALGKITQLQVENERYAQQVGALRQQIDALNRQLGKLEARLEMLESDEDD